MTPVFRRDGEEGEVCTVDGIGRVSDGHRDAMAHAGEPGSLHALLDDLLAMQRDLAGDVMPRAARITGTSHLLLQVRFRLDAAIGTARAMLASETRAPPGGSPVPVDSSTPGTWSVEQECLAAVHAARTVT